MVPRVEANVLHRLFVLELKRAAGVLVCRKPWQQPRRRGLRLPAAGVVGEIVLVVRERDVNGLHESRESLGKSGDSWW